MTRGARTPVSSPRSALEQALSTRPPPPAPLARTLLPRLPSPFAAARLPTPRRLRGADIEEGVGAEHCHRGSCEGCCRREGHQHSSLSPVSMCWLAVAAPPLEGSCSRLTIRSGYSSVNDSAAAAETRTPTRTPKSLKGVQVVCF